MSEETASTRTATGYACFGPRTPLLPTPAWEPGCALYSGGLYATADDLARFVSSQIPRAPAGAGAERILSEESTRAMRSPNSMRIKGRSDSYGLGWAVVRIADKVAIEHNGALTGHTAHASAIPELGIGLVALANTKHYYWSPGHCKDLAREIYRDLVDAIVIHGVDESLESGDIDFERYAGTYELPGGFAHMTVKAADGRLIVSIVEDEEFNEPFIPVTAYEFCFEEDPGRTPMLLFNTDDAGDVVRATFLSYTFFRRVE
jgi:CubicO group peptidase (beta-lactamase class C family)